MTVRSSNGDLIEKSMLPGQVRFEVRGTRYFEIYDKATGSFPVVRNGVGAVLAGSDRALVDAERQRLETYYKESR